MMTTMNHQTILTLLAFFVAFLAPIETVGMAIGFLTLVDIATGIWASVRAGQKVTSDRFSRSVTKSLVYLTALVVANVAQKWVFLGAVPVVTIITGFIGSTELLSIFENLSRISGINFRDYLQDKLLPAQKEKDDRGEGQ